MPHGRKITKLYYSTIVLPLVLLVISRHMEQNIQPYDSGSGSGSGSGSSCGSGSGSGIGCNGGTQAT